MRKNLPSYMLQDKENNEFPQQTKDTNSSLILVGKWNVFGGSSDRADNQRCSMIIIIIRIICSNFLYEYELSICLHVS